LNFSYYWEMSRRLRPLQAAPKAWNYLKYRALPRRAVSAVRRYTPQIGALVVTMRCNLNCSYCSAANQMREGRKLGRKGDLSLEQVQRIFANPLFANCLLVDLLGGEPLLVKDLDRIVAWLTGRGHITNTATNGLLLAERIAELRRAGLSRINLSLYDENRVVIERDLAKINSVFPVHASLVLLRSMLEKRPDDLFALTRFVRDARCRSLRFWMYRPVGANPRPGETISELDPAYLEFRRRVDEALPGFCKWPTAVGTAGVKKRCPQLWQRVTSDALGTMTICCGTDATLQGPDSNLFDGEPDAVFNHPTLVGMRAQLLDPASDPPAVCRSCNLLGDPGW